jgi:DNA-directed RNA polymerase specialized sigma24 family protein
MPEPDDFADEAADVEQAALNDEFRALVDAALTALPRGERAMLHQCAALLVSGHSHAEIGARLKCSTRTVCRMARKLREALESVTSLGSAER